jgi:hypothetical protein
LTLETEILRYVDKKGEEGASWSELEVRFVSKYQLADSLKKRSQGIGKHSKGAFVNAFTNLQKEKSIKKVLVNGKPRYVKALKGKSVHTEEPTPEMYTARIGHTRDLITGFRKLLNYGVIFEQTLPHYHGIPLYPKVTDNDRILKECAESHLKAYPTIYETLEKYRTLSDKYKGADKETKKKIELLKGNVIPLWTREGRFAVVKIKNSVSGTEDELLYISEKEADYLIFDSKINEVSPIDVEEKVTKIRERISETIKGKPRLFPPNEQGYIDKTPFYELLKVAVSMEEAYGEASKEINKLIIRSQYQPLEGSCELCPNFVIKK